MMHGARDPDSASKATPHSHHHSDDLEGRSHKSSSSKAPSWPGMSEIEYLTEKNKTANDKVVLNVGGTKFEVKKGLAFWKQN